jgi:hypothetical protein
MAILPRSCVTLHAQLLAADTTLLVCVRVCIFSLSFVKLNVRPANSPWAPNEQFLSSLRAFCLFAARLGITYYPIASFITHSSQPFAAGHTFITVIAPLMCLAPVLIWDSRTTLFHHFTGVTLALSLHFRSVAGVRMNLRPLADGRPALPTTFTRPVSRIACFVPGRATSHLTASTLLLSCLGSPDCNTSERNISVDPRTSNHHRRQKTLATCRPGATGL